MASTARYVQVRDVVVADEVTAAHDNVCTAVISSSRSAA